MSARIYVLESVAFFLHNKLNGHETDDHMQTTGGPEELTTNKK